MIRRTTRPPCRPLGHGPDAPARPSPAVLPAVRVEERIHLDYCPRRNRPMWESATFTLDAVVVSRADGERRYGPLEPWTETVPDPRAGYHAVGTALVRRAAPGRDYDDARHVAGVPV